MLQRGSRKSFCSSSAFLLHCFRVGAALARCPLGGCGFAVLGLGTLACLGCFSRRRLGRRRGLAAWLCSTAAALLLDLGPARLVLQHGAYARLLNQAQIDLARI